MAAGGGAVMQVTAVQGMRIECPEGWCDRSMLALTAPVPGPSGVTPNVIVTREALPAGPGDPTTRLEEHVDAQVASWRGLDRFETILRRHASLAEPIAEVRVGWHADGLAMTQWVTYALADDMTMVVAAATAGRADFAAIEPALRGVLQTLRLG
jgi:hypothetical protein